MRSVRWLVVLAVAGSLACKDRFESTPQDGGSGSTGPDAGSGSGSGGTDGGTASGPDAGTGGSTTARVAISFTGNGSGRVSSSPAGIDCPGACAMTFANGTAITLSAQADSNSTFIGWGGVCSGMTCTFTVNGDGTAYAHFEPVLPPPPPPPPPAIVLAPADGTLYVRDLALNSTTVFFARAGSNSGIWKVAKTGGPQTLVATWSFLESGVLMAADESYVYWVDGSEVLRAPAAGGRAEIINGTYNGITDIGHILGFLVDSGALYWVTKVTSPPSPAFENSGVYTAPATPAFTWTKLAAGSPTGGIAVDSTLVFWTDRTSTGQIRRVARSGGASDAAIDCSACDPRVVRVDAQNIYYRNADGDAWVRAKGGGDFVKLSSGNPRNASAFNIDLDVSGGLAWWTWNDTTPGDGHGLFRANTDGTGWTAVETSTDSTWSATHADAASAYYFHAGALYRRPR